IADVKQLEDELIKYFTVMRKNNGTPYSTSSIRSCLFVLNRFFNSDLSKIKPIDLNDKKIFSDLWAILNGKFRELSELGYGEIKGSDALTLEEVKIILNNSTTSKESPRGLLHRIFFYNAILLDLRGGEHFTLEASNFIKQKNEEGYIVKIYKSKTNQRTADCPGQAETFNIPNLSD
ncbi:2860_t:CDS:1, partial [Acaulospora morrowiae]